MKNSKEFINSITNGENLEAEMHFSNSMTDKVGAALELRRIELANDSVNEKTEANLIKKTTKLVKDVGTGLGQGMHSAVGAARRKAPALYKKLSADPKTKKYMLKILRKYHPAEFLSNKDFNHNLINDVIKKYQRGSEEYIFNNAIMIWNLYSFSKMMYDLDL